MLPINGALYGAQDYKGIRHLFKTSMLVMEIICVVIMAIFMIFPLQTAAIFNVTSPEAQELLPSSIFMFSLCIPPTGMLFIMRSHYQSTGHRNAATVLTVLEGTAPTGVKLESQSVNIRVGEGYTLNASVRPKDAADKSLFFYSSDESVATVDENGYIKAIKPGVAVVTAESVSAAVSSRCMVKVTASDEQGSMDVNINGVLYSIAGKKMSDYIVEMKGRVTERTTTDSDGKFSLEDIPQGDYTLSVYRSSAPKKAVASAKLAVSSYNLNISCIINSKELVVLYQELAANNADLTDITLQQSAVVLDCGETYDMTFTTRPANAGTPVLSVHSSDEAIAAVDSDYRITGVSPGKATITFTTLDGKITKTCVVTVTRVNSNQYSGIIIGLEITIILLIVILFSISYKKYQREREQSEFLSEEDEEVLEELSED